MLTHLVDMIFLSSRVALVAKSVHNMIIQRFIC
jgi:hypothetical protein